jgi:hypothetical protein
MRGRSSCVRAGAPPNVLRCKHAQTLKRLEFSIYTRIQRARQVHLSRTLEADTKLVVDL